MRTFAFPERPSVRMRIGLRRRVGVTVRPRRGGGGASEDARPFRPRLPLDTRLSLAEGRGIRGD